MNSLVHDFGCTCVHRAVGYVSGDGAAGSEGLQMLSLMDITKEFCHMVLPIDSHTLHFRQV